MAFRSRRRSVNLTSVFSLLLLAAAGASLATAGDADQYIQDIKTGPAVYYTPEAAAYFSTRGSYSVAVSVNKDAAVRTFLATTKLGAMQLGQVREAIPVLIDVFPKAVHVVEIRQATFSGKGSFDDCVSTYVMSAKNQFMMSCPFLDFNSLSACDNFIEGPYETEILQKHANKSGAIIDALFTLRITFTFYGGECALSRLTGMNLGHDPGAWRQWWLSSTSTTPYTTATPYTYLVSSPSSQMVTKNTYSDIISGGKYRVLLTTGDDLTGTVESRDDTSMVLETTGGKPYAFKFTLMQSYQVIELPTPKPVTQAAQTSSGAEIITFDELKLRAPGNPELEVRIANGSVFKGTLRTIDNDGLNMNVEGSAIPITKEVIKQIIFIPPGMARIADKKEKIAQQPQGPFDTIYVKNPQTDNYGRAKPDIMYAGTIIDEGDNYVTMKTVQGGTPQKCARADISRVIRHSSDKSDDAIKRYARALSCPGDMFLVDMPPGRTGKPFFKVCVDKYEFPNKAGNVPRTKLSFTEAKNLCEKQGKRLCTTTEWMWACGGQDGFPYPYGNNLEKNRCNTDTRLIETSGNRINCVSPFGGYDMSGNLFEWVTTKDGGMALMGGPVSKCSTIAAAGSSDAKPQSGVRCCKGD